MGWRRIEGMPVYHAQSDKGWTGESLQEQIAGREASVKADCFQGSVCWQIGKREERIKTEDTDALIQEFLDKKGGNVALARKELRERYKAGKDKQKIAGVFNVSTKSDQQWVKSQIRKERYGDSNGNQWKKPSWK